MKRRISESDDVTSAKRARHQPTETIEPPASSSGKSETHYRAKSEAINVESHSQTREPPARVRRKSKKKKKKNGVKLDDPMKILNSILEDSSFKVPNLSQAIERRFKTNPEMRHALSKTMEELSYESSYGVSNEIDISVLPRAFKGRVVLEPTATTCLPSIYEKKPRSKTSNRSHTND